MFTEPKRRLIAIVAADVEGDSEHVEAYDLVLRGRELWLSFNRDDNLAARGLYLQAIKLDPEYPRAYSGLAWTYASAYNEYWTDDPGVTHKGARVCTARRAHGPFVAFVPPVSRYGVFLQATS